MKRNSLLDIAKIDSGILNISFEAITSDNGKSTLYNLLKKQEKILKI